MTENNRIEYKQILTDDLEKEVVAFFCSSIPKILKSYSKQIFTFSNSYIRTTLPASASVYDDKSKTTQQKSSLKSSVKIIELINQNQNITIPEIAKSIGITTRAIEKQIAKLKEQGILKRIGPDKGGHWKVL